MTEQLLQFIWQHRYFNHHELCVDTGEPLQILSPGEANMHQGPDFLQASIRIGDVLWAGHIELHLRTSGWEKHAHEKDPNYNNVILHVVWENDRDREKMGPISTETRDDGIDGSVAPGGRFAGRELPVLVLQDRVPKLLLGKYEEWMNSRFFVPCERQLPQVGEEVWRFWKRRLLEERLERKALVIGEHLRQNRLHWEETAWWLLARNFGIPVNTGSFAAIAQSLPLVLLSGHRQRRDQLEALLLGQAGLLRGYPEEEYMRSLQPEYEHLRKKYGLKPIHERVFWSRMRPANFPDVRLAQLAVLLERSCRWFGLIRDAGSLKELRGLIDWGTGAVREGPGEQMERSILINTFLPLLFTYGRLNKEDRYRIRALDWLQELAAEKNRPLTHWSRLGVSHRNAAESQALLELKSCYCDARRCLDCAIGKTLLGAVAEPGTADLIARPALSSS